MPPKFTKNNLILPDDLIFVDEGISGKAAGNRPAFQRMIGTAKENPAPFQVILLWKFSRFARNQEESIVYKALLRQQCGVEVVSVSEPLPGGPFSSLIERIIEWFDEFYSIRLSQEVKRTMSVKATRGELQSSPAFGYRAHMEPGKKTVLEPIPEEAEMAGRLAVESAVAGETGKMVAFECTRKNGAYQCRPKLIPLTDVANAEKKVPLDWITPEGNFVTDDFIDYVLPLIQGQPDRPTESSLPRYARLKKIQA